ncbi:schwannomin-interacting protein 1 isoform X1 [Electrophorus electricus]|uniref:schwannomin-interacting protein 1 isoform X1 n=1 Tax=Electrophorus electricus TaxID=8005 RepID=UPI0015CF9E21|nr:schwannomin-interacting protein 1 isoform X1 [Electrophorus electricus]XP_026871411.2 schwannomin-interacting protein 1 isoform X1 [Electrophorus electricus]XP_026871412.2 schwannomin-interacting protein 1 isoform X1 [Electrophorus electricus]XP_026871413.2 schwannomin-interacting protein 1 isoform X1 [Electrophorus electricus]
MDGEKERERERGEEKESDETEEDAEGAALVWQEGYPEDDLDLPIMHWEALSLRIAELERQEEERRERNKLKDAGRWPEGWPQFNRHREAYEEMEDSRLTALTSRLQSHMNLQLCFINSESEDEEEDAKKELAKQGGRSSIRPAQQDPSPVSKSKAKSGGLKKEVRAALSMLKNKLRLEQKQTIPPSDAVKKRTHYKCSDLQNFTLKELNALKTTLSKDIHGLSSELVGRLLTRDQLRTEQDAMLLEIQDMTSL